MRSVSTNLLKVGQAGAFSVCVSRAVDGKKTTSVVLPTRYGKGHLIRCVAMELHNIGFAAYAVGVSPADALREQLGSAEKWRQATAMFGFPQDSACQVITWSPNIRYGDSGAFFWSATIQSVVNSIDLWTQWVDDVRHKTGKSVAFFIDESHSASDANRWGNTAQQLIDAGAYLVLCTGTASRDDGNKIVGFNWDESDERPHSFTLCRAGSTPEKVTIDKYEGVKKLVRLRADYTYSYGQAWDEKPTPAICKVSRIRFDFHIDKITDDDEEAILLSEASASTTRSILSKLVRHPEAIERATSLFMSEFLSARACDPDIQGIFFCGNDRKDDETANAHAEQVREALLEKDPTLRVRIITSSTDGASGKAARDALISFCQGDGDIVIVKQMAGVGMDMPRVKVVCDLSSVRTEAACIQRWMRGGTVYSSFVHFSLITPADCFSDEIFDVWTEGGLGRTEATFAELVETYEVDRSDDKESNPEYFINDSFVSGVVDSNRESGGAEAMDHANAILQHMPQLRARLTTLELSKLGKLMATGPQVTKTRDVAAERKSIRGRCEALIKQIVSHRGPKLIGADYSKEVSKLWHSVKIEAGVPTDPATGKTAEVGSLGTEHLEKIYATLLSRWKVSKKAG